jgi:hypothetical protein
LAYLLGDDLAPADVLAAREKNRVARFFRVPVQDLVQLLIEHYEGILNTERFFWLACFLFWFFLGGVGWRIVEE